MILRAAAPPQASFTSAASSRLHLSHRAAGYLYAAQSLSWTAAALVGARLSGGSASRAVIMGPVMIGVGFAGLLLTLAEGPMTAITLSVILVGAGIGACWAHVGSIVLGSGREPRAR